MTPPGLHDPGYLLPRRATRLAFAGLLLGMLLAVLNQTIIATALPHIVADLGGMDHYSWVFTAYMLGSTVTIPIWGRLSDIHGRRRFFSAGIVIFMAGGVIGATSGSMLQLIAARGVQGIGAGALIPLAIASIGDLVPPSDRGRWQGLVGAAIGVGAGLGPLTGGWIADNVDWPWVFIVSLPFGLVALVVVLATLHVPPHPDRATTVDYRGAALLAGGLSALLLAIVELGGDLDAAGLLVPLAVAIVLLVAFVAHSRSVPEPIVPIDLFTDGLFRIVSVTGFCVGVAMFGAIMFVPLFAQGALGATATSSGLAITPLILGMVAASVISGRIISATGRYRWALLSAPPLMALGFALLLGLDEASTTPSVALATTTLGVGIGLLQQNLVMVLQNHVASKHLGVATSGTQFFRNMGGTVGVSIMGAMLAAGLPAGLTVDTATTQTARAEIASAVHPVFLLGLPLMLVAFLAVRRIPEVPLRRAVRDDVATPTPAGQTV